MRKFLWLVTVLGFGFSRAEEGGEEAKRFVGTWKLISIEDDRGTEVRGARPTGIIYYDAAGNMAAQIMPDRPRAKPLWYPTFSGDGAFPAIVRVPPGRRPSRSPLNAIPISDSMSCGRAPRTWPSAAVPSDSWVSEGTPTTISFPSK